MGGGKWMKNLILPFYHIVFPLSFLEGRPLKEEEEGEWIKNVKPNHPPSFLIFFSPLQPPAPPAPRKGGKGLKREVGQVWRGTPLPLPCVFPPTIPHLLPVN